MRGYFGIGVEHISKPMNVGNLFRSAHAFGADFIFAIAAAIDLRESVGEISKGNVPFFEVIFAPIAVKGSTILCIGLEDKELSPIKVDLNFCADIPSYRYNG